MRHIALLVLGCLAVAPLLMAAEPAPTAPTKEQAPPPTPRELVESMAEDDFRASVASRQLAAMGPAAVPELLRGTEHAVPRVRYWSIASLSSIGSDEAVPAIKKCLDDSDAVVRAVAVWHLGRWFDRADVRDGVLARLEDKDPFVKGWVLRLIASKKYREASPKVRELLKAPEPEVRYDSLHTLAILEGAGALPTLQAALQDASPLVRECAVRSCTLIEPRTPLVGDVLITALDDKDEEVRKAAISLLRKGFSQDFEFRPADPPDARKAAVLKWRRWYDMNKSKLSWSGGKQRFEIPADSSPATAPQ